VSDVIRVRPQDREELGAPVGRVAGSPSRSIPYRSRRRAVVAVVCVGVVFALLIQLVTSGSKNSGQTRRGHRVQLISAVAFCWVVLMVWKWMGSAIAEDKASKRFEELVRRCEEAARQNPGDSSGAIRRVLEHVDSDTQDAVWKRLNGP
jgi:hypothetical protein